MKALQIVAAAMLLSTPLSAQDAVDQLNSEYGAMRNKGLIKLNQRQVAELEKVKDNAMTRKDLPLATKATAAIEALQIESKKLEADLENASDEEGKFPENEFYRMTFSNDKLGTEKGSKIICKFTRKPLNDFAGSKLKLTLAANSSKYSETPHEVFIIESVSGEEIGMVKGLRRGKKKEVELKMPPVETLELTIVVRGGDALHLKPFTPGVPEVYLSIED